MTVTLPAIKGLTILELARASVAAGVRTGDAERLLRSLIDPDPDPADVEKAALMLYAWAWQLTRREEPGSTWDDAQTWRVELDVDAVDDVADAEAEATVEAALATGLPPREAGGLTMAEMDNYRRVAERMAERTR